MPLRGQVFFAAMAMKFEKATLPTRKNKLQQFALHCPIFPCTVLPLISPVVEMSTFFYILGGGNVFDILWGRCPFWYSAGATFSIFCGDNLLAFLRGRYFEAKHHPLERLQGQSASWILCLTWFSSKDDLLDQKVTLGNHLRDNLRLGLAKKRCRVSPGATFWSPFWAC